MIRKRIAGGVHVPDDAFPPGTPYDEKDWYLCFNCGRLDKREHCPTRCTLCDATGDDIRQVEIDDEVDLYDLKAELMKAADENDGLHGVIGRE